MYYTNKFVLVTGTSSGIGKACVLELDKLGFKVFATVRKQEDADNIKKETSKNVTPIIMDITEARSIKSAYETISKISAENGLYGLVNNAGIGVGCPLEFYPLNEIRAQFEINLFGQIAVIQSFLPLIRKGKGRIVNIGSISGIVSEPFLNVYCATKFAFEAITDALRMELKPWNIYISMIDPGAVQTPIWDKAIEKSQGLFNMLPENNRHLYDAAMKSVVKVQEYFSKTGVKPDQVAKAVKNALTSQKPKFRYLIGWDAKITYLLNLILPHWLICKLVSKEMGV